MGATIVKSGECKGYKYLVREISYGEGRELVKYYCGYMLLPSELDFKMAEKIQDYIDVHGGVSYLDNISELGPMMGFDCNHYGDRKNPKSLVYAEGQCRKMIDSFLAYKKHLFPEDKSGNQVREHFMSIRMENVSKGIQNPAVDRDLQYMVHISSARHKADIFSTHKVPNYSVILFQSNGPKKVLVDDRILHSWTSLEEDPGQVIIYYNGNMNMAIEFVRKMKRLEVF